MFYSAPDTVSAQPSRTILALFAYNPIDMARLLRILLILLLFPPDSGDHSRLAGSAVVSTSGSTAAHTGSDSTSRCQLCNDTGASRRNGRPRSRWRFAAWLESARPIQMVLGSCCSTA